MTFIDTGYLVAVAIERDALHHRALAWNRMLQGPFLTTEYVLVEFMNVLSAPPNRAAAHALLSAVQSNASIEIVAADPALFHAGVALHRQRADKSWSLVDCISINLMQKRGITDALAHDQHFEQAGFRALLR